MSRDYSFLEIENILRETGAVAIGYAKAKSVEDKAWNSYLGWIAEGHHAGMAYLENHSAIRRDPRLLLEGAESIISLAFSFKPPLFREEEKGMIACYAYGDDYHDAIRTRIQTAVKKLEKLYGGNYRICIDSAPIMERYWAVKAGIGTIGRNGSVIIPGHGNMCFLAEIVTTLSFDERTETPKEGRPEPEFCYQTCLSCGACVKECPAGAILPDTTIDSNRCLSYLTIEHRGEWTDPEQMEAMETNAAKNIIFGCDLCLRKCPLNHLTPISAITEFLPRKEIMELTKKDVERMEQTDFSRIFKGSPIKRCKLAGIKRNIRIFK